MKFLLTVKLLVPEGGVNVPPESVKKPWIVNALSPPTKVPEACVYPDVARLKVIVIRESCVIVPVYPELTERSFIVMFELILAFFVEVPLKTTLSDGVGIVLPD